MRFGRLCDPGQTFLFFPYRVARGSPRTESYTTSDMASLTSWHLPGNRLLTITQTGIRWRYDDCSATFGRWICASRP